MTDIDLIIRSVVAGRADADRDASRTVGDWRLNDNMYIATLRANDVDRWSLGHYMGGYLARCFDIASAASARLVAEVRAYHHGEIVPNLDLSELHRRTGARGAFADFNRRRKGDPTTGLYISMHSSGAATADWAVGYREQLLTIMDDDWSDDRSFAQELLDELYAYNTRERRSERKTVVLG